MIKLRHAARKPGKSMDFKAVKAEVMKMKGVTETKVRQLNKFKPKTRSNMEKVVKDLGQTELAEQEWLVLTPRDKLPKPAKEAFPRPQKRPDGSYIYDRVPNIGEASTAGATSAGGRGAGGHLGGAAQMLYKKRAYEEKESSAGGASSSSASSAAKVARVDTSGRGHVPNVVPPKGRVATLTRISSGGQKQVSRSHWIVLVVRVDISHSILLLTTTMYVGDILDGCSRRRLLQGDDLHQTPAQEISCPAAAEGGKKTLQESIEPGVKRRRSCAE